MTLITSQITSHWGEGFAIEIGGGVAWAGNADYQSLRVPRCQSLVSPALRHTSLRQYVTTSLRRYVTHLHHTRQGSTCSEAQKPTA